MPLAPPPTTPEGGFRFLQIGETLLANDGVEHEGQWLEVGFMAIGQAITTPEMNQPYPFGYYRRRITLEHAGVGYRMLDYGEQIRPGDEFINTRGNWQPVSGAFRHPERAVIARSGSATGPQRGNYRRRFDQISRTSADLIVIDDQFFPETQAAAESVPMKWWLGKLLVWYDNFIEKRLAKNRAKQAELTAKLEAIEAEKKARRDAWRQELASQVVLRVQDMKEAGFIPIGPDTSSTIDGRFPEFAVKYFVDQFGTIVKMTAYKNGGMELEYLGRNKEEEDGL